MQGRNYAARRAGCERGVPAIGSSATEKKRQVAREENSNDVKNKSFFFPVQPEPLFNTRLAALPAIGTPNRERRVLSLDHCFSITSVKSFFSGTEAIGEVETSVFHGSTREWKSNRGAIGDDWVHWSCGRS